MTGCVIAIVPAAGVGSRFGGGAKQFLDLCGKPMILWSLGVFESMPEVREIIPVVREGDMLFCSDLFQEYGISKVRRIAPGGKERQDSVLSGLRCVEDSGALVLIHDAARPLIDPERVRTALNAFDDCDGVVLGVPPKDTVKEAREYVVEKTLRRDRLWLIQTPQVFSHAALLAAYEEAQRTSYVATDDAALVEAHGGKVKVVMGDYRNLKVTTPEDMKIAELFLTMRGAAA